MPSEKLRHLLSNREPRSPIDSDQLRASLCGLERKHLSELLSVRSQSDPVLRKILMVVASLHSQNVEVSVAKAALDFAIYFPDYVRYSEHGHGQILDEVTSSIKYLVASGQREEAIHVGQYAIELAEKVSENFENDWEWRSALKELTDCVGDIASG